VTRSDLAKFILFAFVLSGAWLSRFLRHREKWATRKRKKKAD